jgi:hypothetical protein
MATFFQFGIVFGTLFLLDLLEHGQAVASGHAQVQG